MPEYIVAYIQPDLVGVGLPIFSVGVGDGNAGGLGGWMDIEKGVERFLGTGMAHYFHPVKFFREK